MTDTPSPRVAPDWMPLVADVLEITVPQARALGAAQSFTALGGTSLQAIALVSQGQRELGLDVPVARILGSEPLAAALATAGHYVRTESAPVTRSTVARLRPPLPGQKTMLAAHLLERDRPYHLIFTLEAPRTLDPRRVRSVLRALASRHESLRTVFTEEVPTLPRLVLPTPYAPRMLRQSLPAGSDAIAMLHELYGRRSDEFLRPFERPPVLFVLTDCGDRSLLTMLAHHVIMDGWSIGVLWHEFAEQYQRIGEDDRWPDPPSPEWVDARLTAMRTSGALDAAAVRVRSRLAGAPQAVILPTGLRPAVEADGRGMRLIFRLDADTARSTRGLALRCQVTVTAVLLAAWALAVARRLGTDDLLLGVPVSGRFEAGMEQIVGLCTRVVPVRCRLGLGGTAEDYVRAVASALAEAVADADLPFEDVVRELGAQPPQGRNPLTQIGFAAHHDLVPELVESGGTWRIHEGHCQGSVFDALLYVQQWSDRPRLALEFAARMVAGADAGEMAESFQAALTALVRAPDAPEGAIDALSPAQRRRLRELGEGRPFETADDVWTAFERHVHTVPQEPAIVDGHRTFTYRELHRHALRQARLLRDCGVRAGDRVVLEIPRSAAEAVAVLGVLRLGASYVAVDEQATAQWRAYLAEAVAPRVRIGALPPDPALADVPRCPMSDLDLEEDASESAEPGERGSLPAHVRAPLSPVYVSFTSGSTGVPKGVVVPSRAVLRLAADRTLLADSDGMAMLRLSPLAFDASTLELLVPLVSGACVMVYPVGEPTPSALASFFSGNRVTHAWLTSGFFHLVADHVPEAFRSLRQLLTGGGVVSPAHVRRVLEHCPGLRLTNGYGPTENTTFTATYAVNGVHAIHEPLPIGRPVLGTEIRVVDRAGRTVPPGAVGELWAGGAGVADGYLADAERTAQSFVVDEQSSARLYRTGDLVRWDADGDLRFLGRADRQIKTAGHRVEPADIECRIRLLPGVLDAMVFLAGDGPTRERLCAAVKPGPGGVDLPRIRAAVDAQLAPYARPQRWVLVERFPLDGNGKVDLRALVAAADRVPAPPTIGTGADRRATLIDLEDLVASTWAEVLGTDDFDLDEAFFEIGGDSLRIAMVRRLIQERLGGAPLDLTDFYEFPTVQALAGHLHARMAEGGV